VVVLGEGWVFGGLIGTRRRLLGQKFLGIIKLIKYLTSALSRTSSISSLMTVKKRSGVDGAAGDVPARYISLQTKYVMD
jgi:hypothetical protein